MNAYRFVCLVCIGIAVMIGNVHMPAAAQQKQKTLQSFGVQVKHGQPVYPLPTNVALGLFNPEDPFLDIAYYADRRVQVFQNLGNGLFSDAPVFDRRVSGEVAAMQWRMRNPYFRSPSDLVITYADGREETIANEWMREQTRSFASLPQMESSFPPLNFREVWRSPRNWVHSVNVFVDDIDNDGRNEAVYFLYEGPPAAGGKLVVYENIGNDQWVVDWDTLFSRDDGGPLGITDIDNDGHKEIVCGYSGGSFGAIGFLECFGPRQYRWYRSNIGFTTPLVKTLETDIDHDGVKELTVLTSDQSRSYDQTFIYIAEFVAKGPGSDGWRMAFNQQLARVSENVYDMAVGQMDGQGWDEIVLGDGAWFSGGQEYVTYMKYDGPPGPFAWRPHFVSTGLSGTCLTPMFVNLDADTTQELLMGGVGPVFRYASVYALKYVSDTTWRTAWFDSPLAAVPLWVNKGMLQSLPVVATSGVWRTATNDTVWNQLRAYTYKGQRVVDWRKDSTSIQQFQILDVDYDTLTDIVCAEIGQLGSYLKNYEVSFPTGTKENSDFPETVSLHQNFPNPFNPTTTITFEISEQGNVTLTIYDILGREIENVANETLEPGKHTIRWNGTNNSGQKVSSGIYFYELRTQNKSLRKKMLLLR